MISRALGILLALSLLWGGVQTYRVTAAKRETAEVQAVAATERANAAMVALKAQTDYRALESQLQAVKEQAQHDYDAVQTRNASLLARARAGNDQLRQQLATYAAGSGAPAGDTLAAADQRAAVLGGLLAAALLSDAGHTADAESNADAVRALLAAWPHEVKE